MNIPRLHDVDSPSGPSEPSGNTLKHTHKKRTEQTPTHFAVLSSAVYPPSLISCATATTAAAASSLSGAAAALSSWQESRQWKVAGSRGGEGLRVRIPLVR